MHEILTAAQMRCAERITIEENYTSTSALMEQAGEAVAQAVVRLVNSDLKSVKAIAILCGSGNNGGDGFVAARSLFVRGFKVTIGLISEPSALELEPSALESEPSALKNDARQALRELSAAAGWDERSVQSAWSLDLTKYDLLIDAMFGIGLNKPVTGKILDLIVRMNESARPIVSIDMPSGIDSDSGAIAGAAVQAQETVTFFRPKIGHFLFPGRNFCGRLTVAQIDISQKVLSQIKPTVFHNCPSLWSEAFPKVEMEQHKYQLGHCLVWSGPPLATGASRLAAYAALRAGCGLVSLIGSRDALNVQANHVTALMLKQIDDAQALAELLTDQRIKSVIIGPASGIGDFVCDLVQAVCKADRSLVLDADALTSFAGRKSALIEMIGHNNQPVILTPHEGEFVRIFGAIGSSKLEAARLAACNSGAIIILKGADSIIAAPDGQVAVNDNAPTWLATAGSGDVLAGIVGGFLARGMSGFSAACAGVFVHGRAGAAAGRGLIAEDLILSIRSALLELGQ